MEHYRFVDEVMSENNDQSSRQFYAAFKTAYPSTEVSLSTIKRTLDYEENKVLPADMRSE